MWYSLTSMPYLSNPGFSNEFSSSNEAPLPIQYIGCPRKRKGLLGLKVFYRTPIKIFIERLLYYHWHCNQWIKESDLSSANINVYSYTCIFKIASIAIFFYSRFCDKCTYPCSSKFLSVKKSNRPTVNTPSSSSLRWMSSPTMTIFRKWSLIDKRGRRSCCSFSGVGMWNADWI